MCTVSFRPQKSGFSLAMNRDEKLSRPRGLPPDVRSVNGIQVIQPSEPDGGTWISLSEHAICLALINWYSAPQPAVESATSRGRIIPALIDAQSDQEVRERLCSCIPKTTRPFRLIGVFPNEKALCEWRWDGKRLESVGHSWSLEIWISSGVDEAGAQRTRGATFLQHRIESDAAQPDWQRRLHSSHFPEKGAYSVCMHRNDAATVSFSEITVGEDTARFDHCQGSPCCSEEWSTRQLDLR